ncbi:MAG: leucine-rich repeat protein, partial [Verrucomicrobiales bacterium]|nr:leucine-rich repeat protein [Verrucomicrobiales bacterium]
MNPSDFFIRLGILAPAGLGTGLSALVANAFAGCSRLSEVSIPDTVRSIGDNAFGACPDLRHIAIPASVRVLGVGVFHDNFTFRD